MYNIHILLLWGQTRLMLRKLIECVFMNEMIEFINQIDKIAMTAFISITTVKLKKKERITKNICSKNQ